MEVVRKQNSIIIKILTIEQISNFVEIDLKVGNFYVEFQVLLHGVNMIEDVVDNPGDDALHGGVVDDSLHGVGLPG